MNKHDAEYLGQISFRPIIKLLFIRKIENGPIAVLGQAA